MLKTMMMTSSNPSCHFRPLFRMFPRSFLLPTFPRCWASAVGSLKFCAEAEKINMHGAFMNFWIFLWHPRRILLWTPRKCTDDVFNCSHFFFHPLLTRFTLEFSNSFLKQKHYQSITFFTENMFKTTNKQVKRIIQIRLIISQSLATTFMLHRHVTLTRFGYGDSAFS